MINFLKDNSRIKRMSAANKNKEGRYLVIDFGLKRVEIIYVEVRSKKINLLNYDELLLASDLENNDDLIINFIKGFRSRYAISEKKVILSLSKMKDLFLEQLEQVSLKEKEIESSAKFHFIKDVPFGTDNSIIDWQYLTKPRPNAKQESNKKIFVFANKEITYKYLSYVTACRLTVISITCSPFQLANIIENTANPSDVVVVLNFGHYESTLNFYVDGQLHHVRALPIYGEKLTASLMCEIASPQGKIYLSREQAEEVKREIGFGGTKTGMAVEPAQVMALIRPHLEFLIRDIKSSLNSYFYKAYSTKKVKLYITGSASNIKNFDKCLEGALGLDTQNLPVSACLSKIALRTQQFSEEDQHKIVNTVGAVFNQPNPIDLFPEEIRRKKIEKVQTVILGFIGTIIIVVFLYLFYGFKFQFESLQMQINERQNHLVFVTDILHLKNMITQRESLINDIQKHEMSFEGILKTLSVLTPDKIVLSELNISQNIMTIQGQILDLENKHVLSDYVKNLKKSVFFANANVLLEEGTNFTIKVDMIDE